MIRKSILIIIPTLKYGAGAEKIAASLANELKDKYEVTLLTFYTNDKEYDLDNEITRINFNEKLNKNIFSKIYFAIARIVKIRSLIKNKNFDYKVSFIDEANYFLILSTLLSKHNTNLYPSIHAMEVTWRRKKVGPILLGRSTKTIVISKQMEKLYSKLGYKHLKVIYNLHYVSQYLARSEKNIDSSFSKWKDGKIRFVNVGRMTYAKAQWHVIKSFYLFSKSHPEAVLLILGEGMYREQLKKLVLSLGLEDRIFMPGVQENIFPFLRHAHATLIGSYTEALPNIIIESLAVGTPILSTDCVSGPREIIAPELDLDERVEYPYKNSYGILVKSFTRNVDFSSDVSIEEDQYADAMREILKMNFDPDELRERGMFFDSSLIMPQWFELFEESKNK